MEIKRSIYFNKSGIYCFINKINRKRYIGQAKSIYTRYRKHFRGESDAPKFENVVKKYGWDNFDIEILEECSIDILDDREEYWILFYKTLDDNFGYNILQRQNVRRKPHTEETKTKIKESLKIAFPDGISGENNPFYGKKHSEDTLKIISDKSKGRISANRKAVTARNEIETKDFPCLTLAAKSVNGFRELIWKAIKDNKQYKGYTWEYAN